MSAPRKIWAPHHVGARGPYYPSAADAEEDYGGTAQVYHHNDVVRELVEALERARSFIHGPGDRCGPVLRHIDALLAKIAQHDS